MSLIVQLTPVILATYQTSQSISEGCHKKGGKYGLSTNRGHLSQTSPKLLYCIIINYLLLCFSKLLHGEANSHDSWLKLFSRRWNNLFCQKGFLLGWTTRSTAHGCLSHCFKEQNICECFHVIPRTSHLWHLQVKCLCLKISCLKQYFWSFVGLLKYENEDKISTRPDICW